MTLPELEHHLGTAFNLIKEQSEALQILTDMITGLEGMNSEAGKMYENSIAKTNERIERLEQRVADLHGAAFKGPMH